MGLMAFDGDRFIKGVLMGTGSSNGRGTLQRSTLLLAMFIAAACAAPKTADAPIVSHRPALKVGEVAPRFSVLGLKGDSVVVGDSAKSVTLLNVWATWCTSCREEFAELERIRKETDSRGLDVVAISVDQGTDVKVRKFVEAQGSGFRVAHDKDSRITGPYGIAGLPTSFLLDKSGKVLWTWTGDFRLDSAGMANAIAKALAQ
ncbi:MAG: TlpA disulfide reductase family protein [Gemmatimonadaceae bacterium]